MDQQCVEPGGARRGGPFAAFVLLREARWDPEQFKKDLLEGWDIPCPAEESAAGRDGSSLVFGVEGMTAAVGLMPFPVPDGEAERNAKNNYLWPEAAAVTKRHCAHLAVAVLGGERVATEAASLCSMITATCCKQEGVLGVYACGTVFEPGFYEAMAEVMKEGELPLYNWVYFGLYRSEGGLSAYTYGLNAFGKDEMEVLDTPARPEELRDFLFNMVYYVLEQDVTLRDGETIGFSAEQKLPITRSTGVSLDGMTLKLGYPEA